MSQATESTNIMSTINKIEEYKELLQKVLPFTKSENEIVKRAAYDFNILLKSAINEKNSTTLLFLNEGIKHTIDHFTTELLDLINNRIDPNIHMGDSHYGLLNDIAKVICQQLLFKNKLNEVKVFLMEI
jgi:hypothetical protein